MLQLKAASRGARTRRPRSPRALRSSSNSSAPLRFLSYCRKMVCVSRRRASSCDVSQAAGSPSPLSLAPSRTSARITCRQQVGVKECQL